jgi:hypothetical protein
LNLRYSRSADEVVAKLVHDGEAILLRKSACVIRRCSRFWWALSVFYPSSQFDAASLWHFNNHAVLLLGWLCREVCRLVVMGALGMARYHVKVSGSLPELDMGEDTLTVEAI